MLIDLCRDIWGYVSLGYFRQQAVAGEVGSSTMPHKVNPIDFENAEGNLGSPMRCCGSSPRSCRCRAGSATSPTPPCCAISASRSATRIIAVQSVSRGLGKIEPTATRLADDLDGAWEVLAEPIQTVMRRYAVPEAYEQLKELTRGRRIDAAAIASFVDGLPLPDAEKARLKALTPADYVGLAARLARDA